MKYDEIEKPAIGCWTYICCDMDLRQIKTQEQLDEELSDYEDNMNEGLTQAIYFKTKVGALMDIRPSWRNYPEEQKRIDEEINFLNLI